MTDMIVLLATTVMKIAVLLPQVALLTMTIDVLVPVDMVGRVRVRLLLIMEGTMLRLPQLIRALDPLIK